MYLLKTQQVETVQHLAAVLGRNRVTVQRWLSQYRSGGLKKLLRVNQPQGRPRSIPEWAIAALKLELKEPEGFETYGEIRALVQSSFRN